MHVAYSRKDRIEVEPENKDLGVGGDQQRCWHCTSSSPVAGGNWKVQHFVTVSCEEGRNTPVFKEIRALPGTSAKHCPQVILQKRRKSTVACQHMSGSGPSSHQPTRLPFTLSYLLLILSSLSSGITSSRQPSPTVEGDVCPVAGHL